MGSASRDAEGPHYDSDKNRNYFLLQWGRHPEMPKGPKRSARTTPRAPGLNGVGIQRCRREPQRHRQRGRSHRASMGSASRDAEGASEREKQEKRNDKLQWGRHPEMPKGPITGTMVNMTVAGFNGVGIQRCR